MLELTYKRNIFQSNGTQIVSILKMYKYLDFIILLLFSVGNRILKWDFKIAKFPPPVDKLCNSKMTTKLLTQSLLILAK